MLDVALFQQVGKPFRFLNRCGTYQHRLTFNVQVLNFFGGSNVLLVLRAVHRVRVLDAAKRLISGNYQHIKFVNLVELCRLGLSRSGHAGQLFIHAEVVLERDSRECLVFLLDA